MDAYSQEGGKRQFITSRRVQSWFLLRSRDKLRAKYKELKAESRRLKYRVKDMALSREMWRERVRNLVVENATLREQVAKKKSGCPDGVAIG